MGVKIVLHRWVFKISLRYGFLSACFGSTILKRFPFEDNSYLNVKSVFASEKTEGFEEEAIRQGFFFKGHLEQVWCRRRGKNLIRTHISDDGSHSHTNATRNRQKCKSLKRKSRNRQIRFRLNTLHHFNLLLVKAVIFSL